MPRGDRTGPRGEGPRTGRAVGYCARFSAPGYARPGNLGRGLGAGRGCGRRGWGGRASWLYGPLVPAPGTVPQATDEKAYLEDMVRSLETELEELRSRLQNLE